MKRSLAILALAAIAACKQDATQILVVVDTDLSVPDQLSRVRAQILRTGAPEVLDEREITVTPERVPFSFGVAPSGDDLSGEVVIELEAIGGTPPAPLFRNRAVTQFVEGKTLRLTMYLLGSCIEAWPCTHPLTCSDGACSSDHPGPLPEVTAGEELEDLAPPPRRDAGITDSGQPQPDTGPTQFDSGPTPADTGSTPADTGPTPPDSGPTTTDSGPTQPDSGPTTSDSGPTQPDGGPTQPDSGPTPTDSGPTPADSGPTPADAGPPPTDAAPPPDGGPPPDGAPLPDGAEAPYPCTTPSDCIGHCNFTGGTMGCTCAMTPMGTACIPACTTNADCPPAPGPSRCDTTRGVCTP